MNYVRGWLRLKFMTYSCQNTTFMADCRLAISTFPATHPTACSNAAFLRRMPVAWFDGFASCVSLPSAQLLPVLGLAYIQQAPAPI